jgi:glycosyltransferase involved in cell wall biosynthesis
MAADTLREPQAVSLPPEKEKDELGLVGQGSEAADAIEEFDFGFRVDQMDVTSVVEALERWAGQSALLERHKRNARRALEERFTRAQALRQYMEVLNLTR